MPKAFTLESEQTIYQASETHQRLLAAFNEAEKGLEVDLSQVNEADSTLIQILIWLQNESVRLHRPVQLLAPSDTLKELVQTLGLNASFPADFGARP